MSIVLIDDLLRLDEDGVSGSAPVSKLTVISMNFTQAHSTFDIPHCQYAIDNTSILKTLNYTRSLLWLEPSFHIWTTLG